MGLPSGKSVYQILVEKFLRAQQVAHGSKKLTKQAQNCKLLIMASQSNYLETKKIFKDNNYFGASRKNFLFYTQGMVP